VETYVDVMGYEGEYRVSNYGDVISLKYGRVRHLKIRPSHEGYSRVSLVKNGKAKEYKICRLVALHFIANPYNKKTVNHIDGVKANDYYKNLEWATRNEQMLHAYKLGLKKPVMFACILSDEQVREIRRRYKGHSPIDGMKALAKEYGVSNATIDKCVRRKSYRDVK